MTRTLACLPVLNGTVLAQAAGSSYVRRAWSAYDMGRLQPPEAKAHLIGALRAIEPFRASPHESEEAGYLLAPFDGLIVSGAAVPSAALEPFAGHWRSEVQ